MTQVPPWLPPPTATKTTLYHDSEGGHANLNKPEIHVPPSLLPYDRQHTTTTTTLYHMTWEVDIKTLPTVLSLLPPPTPPTWTTPVPCCFPALQRKVGIKSTNIGSLIRQAPWLVLQPIDGQMLPVVRFLRIAGVVDVERVLRAYPKVLSASIRGELAPRVSEGVRLTNPSMCIKMLVC